MQNALSRIVALATVGSFVLFTGLPGSAAVRPHRGTLATAGAANGSSSRFGVEPFIRGNGTLFAPDAVVVTKHFVFVAYQNASDSTSGPSTLAKYSRSGAPLGTVNLNGRCDGVRLDPYTHALWALVNNDGRNGSPPRRPALYVIDPHTLGAKLYHFDETQLHGGGYDDLAFIGGHAFLSASAPTLTAGGVNDKPIAVEARLVGSHVDVRPILYGNATAFDRASGKVVRLNITDPDALAVDSQHDLVIVSEGDAQMVFVANPGERNQFVARIATGTQLDDTAWTAGTRGTFYVADATQNVVYRIDASFAKGTVFTEASLGAPVGSFIGSLDPSSGTITPLLTVRDGIVDPTSLIFVAEGSEDDD